MGGGDNNNNIHRRETQPQKERKHNASGKTSAISAPLLITAAPPSFNSREPRGLLPSVGAPRPPRGPSLVKSQYLSHVALGDSETTAATEFMLF